MNSAPAKTSSGGRRRLLIIGGVVAGVLVLVGVIGLLSAPKIAENVLRGQLERVEERTGLVVEMGSLETAGLDGLILHDLVLTLPTGEVLGEVKRVQVDVALLQAARGRPAASGLHITGAHLTFHRDAAGTVNLESLRPRDVGVDVPEPIDDEATGDPLARIEDLLRHFGGAYPELTILDSSITFTSEAEGAWPLTKVQTDRFEMAGGRTEAPFETTLIITPAPFDGVYLPKTVTIEGALRLPARRSTVFVEMEPSLRLSDVGPLAFAEVSLSAFAVDDDYTLRVHQPRVTSRLRAEPETLLSASHVEVRLDGWPNRPRDLSLLEMDVHGLNLALAYSANGAFNLQELYQIARQPAARNAAATARSVAEAMARLDAQSAQAGDDPSDPGQDPGADLAAGPDPEPSATGGLPIRRLFAELPQHTSVKDFHLTLTDERHHEELTRPARRIEVRGEVIDVRHRPIQGILDGELRFQTDGDGHEGRVAVDLSIPYRRGDWKAEVEIDHLELAHLSQIGGPRLARLVHGGEITANLEIDNEGGRKTSFDGFFVGRDLRFFHASLTESPVEVPSTSLRLKGYHHPEERMPPVRLIDGGDEDEDEVAEAPIDEVVERDSDEKPPPNRGALVIEEATARLGEVEATFGLGLHGLESGRMPNRAVFHIDLPRTPLQDILAAIPEALYGPLLGIDLRGELTWNFELEVPLYEAVNMRWNADVDLSGLEVVYLPGAVDVFKLTSSFEHTIRDEWKGRVHYREREFIYERTIRIPEMRPTPATWLLETTPLELDRIDRVRRNRGWPEVPSYAPAGVSREVLNTPDFWLTPYALNQAAPRPWNDRAVRPQPLSFWERWGEPSEPADDGILRFEAPDPLPASQYTVHIDPNRYGDYVYVPLHHISPYLPRAIMTTEDTSFFTHRGFNYLAIRSSVQANINAGRFVRGASTISMQLAKNLFLDRSRVLSRKLQEVTLVWLMESVADIPKERMMELYLNIIEFGPGIFGINEASMHYFGKRADELTVGEVAWLVSIVPSPKRRHAFYDRGEISQVWFRRMARYIRAMYNRDRLTTEEMEAALDEIPTFYRPEDGEPLLRRFAEPAAPEPHEEAEAAQADDGVSPDPGTESTE